MKTFASRKEKGKRLSNVTNLIILGETRELKGKLPKIISKQKILKEHERYLTKEK